jgi:hypothetical protein
MHFSGLCSGSKFDSRYSWTRKMVDARHSFRGYVGTMLQYNSSSNEWTLRPHQGDGNTVATTVGPEYPFGNHVWKVQGDPCYGDNVSSTTLNINACNNVEFNCNDGNCISIEERCNGHTNCPDQSGKFASFCNCRVYFPNNCYLY